MRFRVISSHFQNRLPATFLPFYPFLAFLKKKDESKDGKDQISNRSKRYVNEESRYVWLMCHLIFSLLIPLRLFSCFPVNPFEGWIRASLHPTLRHNPLNTMENGWGKLSIDEKWDVPSICVAHHSEPHGKLSENFPMGSRKIELNYIHRYNACSIWRDSSVFRFTINILMGNPVKKKCI